MPRSPSRRFGPCKNRPPQGLKSPSRCWPAGARLNRLLKKSEKQIPRGLKPARDDKNKRLSGTAEAVPFQIASAHGVLQQPVKPCPDTKRFMRSEEHTSELQS